MAVPLKNWLDAMTAIPAAVEAKFTKLPKLSATLLKFDAAIPAGPSIYPDPPAGGLPVFFIPDLPAPPDIFGSPTTTGSRLDMRDYPPFKVNSPTDLMALPGATTISGTPTPAGGLTKEVYSRRGF